MRRTITLAVTLACVAALCALACSGGAESKESPTRDSGAASADTTRPGKELSKVLRSIASEKERLRNVEGREGILAEERLYSAFDEELIIRDFFQDRRGGFFLDVGCAWAVEASNTYYLENHLGWRGIGIDALADYAPGWKEKRPNSRFFSYLVTDQSGIRHTFFKSSSLGLSSTRRNMASAKRFGADLETEEVEIETITLDDLLDREGVTKIDLLSMDIEGHEPKALAGFEIERFQPELVVIEKQVTPRASDHVDRYFRQHGYELIEKYRPIAGANRYFRRK